MGALKCMKCPSYYLPTNPLGEILNMVASNSIIYGVLGSPDCTSSWSCVECGRKAPPGYSDKADEKVAATIAKMEEEGLTPEACQQFLKVVTTVVLTTLLVTTLVL